MCVAMTFPRRRPDGEDPARPGLCQPTGVAISPAGTVSVFNYRDSKTQTAPGTPARSSRSPDCPDLRAAQPPPRPRSRVRPGESAGDLRRTRRTADRQRREVAEGTARALAEEPCTA